MPQRQVNMQVGTFHISTRSYSLTPGALICGDWVVREKRHLGVCGDVGSAEVCDRGICRNGQARWSTAKDIALHACRRRMSSLTYWSTDTEGIA